MLLSRRQSYSPAERLSDAVVHVSGIAVASVAVPVLVTLALLLHHDRAAIAGTALYGLALIAMLVCSALYNMTDEVARKAFFRHLDHTAIFILIAATYTVFQSLSGTAGWLVPTLWVAAAAGALIRFFAPDRLKLTAVAIALGMGWAGSFAGAGFLDQLSLAVIILIVTGGALYTLGVGFFLFDRLPFHYTIWHGLVLTASLVFYAAVIVHLVQTAT
jgi:hemolysin III